IAGDALAFYLYKFVCPTALTLDYARKPAWMINHVWFYWTWLAPAGAAAAIRLWRPGRRWLGAAALLLLAGLLPVLGLVPFEFQGYSTVADHYMYLAMLGPSLAGAWLLARYPGPTGAGIAAVVLGMLGVG